MPATKPILKWQYEQITKELLLLQGHASDPACPCASDGEACVRKHLLTIEALAEESIGIEPSEATRDTLAQLADECKEKRAKEERKLCGHEVEWEDLAPWARAWRKKFEPPACNLVEHEVHGGDHHHAHSYH